MRNKRQEQAEQRLQDAIEEARALNNEAISISNRTKTIKKIALFSVAAIAVGIASAMAVRGAMTR